ncbi:multidrug resistance-associated protein 1-like isoform X4 [Portunus trituberculatus]|uniref:multidrug resistance-associated protein 1-like isoform X4 n=1 Tax=Portunus trituberculatus TaxID=210409 RepID=UPI001E1CEFCE|nr:multidrug resistance-associated protein 1-like isoform X4 [Portunus trituberculatus]
MTSELSVWDFCGSPLWDANLTWYTDTPQFPRCFERTVFAWIPCAFLWVLAPLETHYIICSRDRHVPWSWVNLSKLVGSLVLLLLQLIDFVYALHQWRIGQPIYAVHFVTPALLFVSLFLQSAVVLVERKRGFQSSGYLFLFWLLCVVCFLPEYVSHISAGPYQEGEGVYFGTFMVFYPFTVGMLLIHCFGDASPRYVHYPRSHKYCPEVSASFLSKITFSWINSLIWKGYKQPLENDDLWDISYENASNTIVEKWNKSWKKNSAKAYNKGQSHTYATFNNTDQVELSGQAGNKEHYLSILPTLVKVFSSSFCFGAFLKFLHDVLQFLSPQILSALITFTESTEEEAPAWHGILYAVLMLVCAQCQSFLLGQYFAWMMVVGLQMRTGIISAVYGKAMRISSSAKKESTVGEIVNLMSVDAQRFMDITTYINMLWSAPMQIILAIYFLWNLLGPSVLAGLAVMIVLIPINGFIANKTKKLQIKQMKLKDERVKLMNEILNGIKVLKLYAWEPSFESQVTTVRNKEVKVLREAAYFNAGTNFIWNCAPFMVSVATFAVYVNVSPDNILDAKTAFVSLSLFNLLRFPLAMLPMLITSMVQAHVSLKRINKFMNADELDTNSVQGDPTYKHPIVVENGTFAWGHEEEDSKPVLKGLNLTVQTGSLVAVVGTVGTGKSSLLSAILGEMEKQSGRVNVKGKVAYVAQQAWIQNTTLEKNILFNQPKVDDLYEACLQSCALQSDLAILPGGDQTEIGEKGINLSGGQKQRVSLARAIYSDADIFLLDDPLSAVDSHVGKHIFDHVIGRNGMLKNKTRVLVTHGLTYLPQTDRIIVLKDNQISEQGTFKELLQKKGPFQEFLLQYLASDSEELDNLEELEDIKHQLESSLGRDVMEQQLVREKRASESESLADSDCSKHVVRRQSSQRISESSVGKETQAPPPKKKGEKLIEAEKTETGRVQTEVYKYYMKSIGIPILIWTMCCFVVAQTCIVGSSVWLSIWSEDTSMDSSSTDMYLGVYGALGIGQAIFVFAGAFSMSYGTLNAGARLHYQILHSVMHLPMHFFDTNPVGRMINRFGKDMDTLDTILPMTLRSWAVCFFTVLSTFAVIIYATHIFIVVMIPTIIIYIFIQIVYVSTSRQLKRLESVSRSPIYSHFQESIQGASTIRAYGRRDQFIKASELKVDLNQICYYPSVISNRWLATRLEFIGNVITFFAALFAVLSRETIDGGKVGLSVTYALSVTQTLHWLIRMSSEVETNIVAVERIKEYTETPQEAPWDLPNTKPQTDWPQEGVVEFNNYSTRYREGLDLVIKNINCKITKGEKIGIVGRTGAGKSSLTLGLFRIIEAAGGNITIDGINISKIGLHDLRSCLTIIPQDPVLFSGTLRMNLDPFNYHSDEKVWSALEHAHLKNFVSTLSSGLQHSISEGGDNLSVGQRQLVCLARALLRKTRVLVLDEATAAVDLETDDLIQQTIRQKFVGCTVLTIAHRLNTIMDYSKVMVLDKGEIKEFESPGTLLKNKNSIFHGMAKDAGLV